LTEAEILHWIKETALGAAIRESRWLFWAGQSLHFVGLSLLLGGMLIVDLRLLGFFRRVPIRAALAFLRLALLGFLINLATGIVFFTMDPFMYWPNPAFRLKMALILLAGLNALVFAIMEYRHVLTLRSDESTGMVAKVTAGLSLGLWLAVLLLGRLLPSFEGSKDFF
jgi:Family of unknown function (DUF6644)